GLGATIPSIAEALGEFTPFDKTSYSIMGDPAIAEALRAFGKKNIVITGIESHICVAQSALDLLEEGYDVFICGDCVSSRKPEDQRLA
ncbi:MAG: isochorismatase family protein, partial [Firmicutes bacterium]|nr:isochorismatase family protein [Bacillota bacterium]